MEAKQLASRENPHPLTTCIPEVSMNLVIQDLVSGLQFQHLESEGRWHYPMGLWGIPSRSARKAPRSSPTFSEFPIAHLASHDPLLFGRLSSHPPLARVSESNVPRYETSMP